MEYTKALNLETIQLVSPVQGVLSLSPYSHLPKTFA